MERYISLLAAVLFVAELTVPHVFAASRSKMSGELNDASDITWAHAVNSRDALDKALQGPVDFLEADISLGHVVGSENYPQIPIMAHPPDTTSDISLDTWLNTVAAKRADKGLKLDFKSLEVLEPSLIVLEKHSSKLNSSVWLNADVISGPVNSSTDPVQVEPFLALCKQYFPNAMLSIGWTTYWYPTFTEDSWHYDWKHARRMADVIHCGGYEKNYPKFTFPVRGIFASRSIEQLQWLLRTIPGSSLTVWTGKHDPLKLEDLLRIRSSFPKNAVYYDVPEGINTQFQEKKKFVDVLPYGFNEDDDRWITLTKGQGDSCSALTYVKNNTIVFGKSLTTAVLQKNLIILHENDNLRVTGKIKFFTGEGKLYNHAELGVQELSIVLTDVSLFAKHASDESRNEIDLTSSDTEVLWSAINSSIVYTFHYKLAQLDSPCRIFKLDTSEDKSFQVWTVPCDVMLEELSFEELFKHGVPEISPRKRLVLPKNPFMLGFMSSSDEHVVVYDLKLKAHKEAFSSPSSSSKTTLGILTITISLFALIFTLF